MVFKNKVDHRDPDPAVFSDSVYGSYNSKCGSMPIRIRHYGETSLTFLRRSFFHCVHTTCASVESEQGSEPGRREATR
jgi:hypothetical protein